jgi:hypothetical protein
VREQLEQRISELRAEQQKGQQMLGELEGRLSELRQTMLRISGAIQVLEELLAGASPEGVTPLATDGELKPAHATE